MAEQLPEQVIDEEIPPNPQPRPAENKDRSWWQKVVGFFADAAEWVVKTAGDPAVADMLRKDLGVTSPDNLPTIPDLPLPEIHNLRAYASGTDISAEAFAATVDQITTVMDAVLSVMEAMDDTATDADSQWELFRKIIGIYASQSVRARDPMSYAMFKAAGVFTEQFGTVERLDWDRFADLFANRTYSTWEWRGLDSYRARQFSDLFTFIVQQIIGNVMSKFPKQVDSYYGWDTNPADVGNADTDVMERMWTLHFRSSPTEPLSGGMLMTFALVPEEHGGPGLMMSLGGQVNASVDVGDGRLTLGSTSTSALNFFAGYTDDGFVYDVDPSADDLGQSFSISYAPKPPDPADPRPPALRWGNSDGVHFQVGSFALGGAIRPEILEAQVDLLDCEFEVPKGESSLLDAFFRDGLKLEFSAAMRFDTVNGLHLANGSGLHTLVPLNRTLARVTLHHVELGLQAPDNQTQALEFFLNTAATLDLGLFRAFAERFGFREMVSWGDGNRGFDTGFQPPKGVAITMSGGGLKGGGYLFLDPAKHEYSGVLEVTYSKFTFKAIGILTTDVPNADIDFALVALITAEFPPWGPIAGVGGMIGVHHGLDIDALQNGVRAGVLDSILFPKDPTANPHQVINQVRTVFPITPGALTAGLMLKLSFAGGSLQVLLGLLVQFDNAIGDDDTDASLNRLSVIGRIQILVPSDAKKPKVKIVLDIAGSFDFPQKYLAVDGRLRDSKLGSFTITGSGSGRRQDYVRAAPGVESRLPSQVITVGGWHPRFKDIPAGIPKQDRFGFSIKSKKGAKTKYEVAVKSYFADTPNTRQIGVEATAKATRWGFKVEAWFGFDGIWYQNPDYFELDIKVGATIKRGGTTLMTADLKVYVRGSGYWIVKGSAKVKLLLLSKTVEFHEEWGEQLTVVPETARVEDFLTAAVEDPRNWTAQLPGSSDMLVSLRDSAVGNEVLAHPLGDLSFDQNVVPLGIEIEKFGDAVPSGATRFDITEVKIGQTPETISPRKSYFSRGEFLDLNPIEKLTTPSFELMGSGVSVDVVENGFPGVWTSAVPDYELKYRGRDQKDDHLAPDFGLVKTLARHGAAARSKFGRNPFGGGPTDAATHAVVRVKEPPMVVVDKDTLVPVDGRELGSFTEASQISANTRHQVVEAHELEAA